MFLLLKSYMHKPSLSTLIHSRLFALEPRSYTKLNEDMEKVEVEEKTRAEPEPDDRLIVDCYEYSKRAIIINVLVVGGLTVTLAACHRIRHIHTHSFYFRMERARKILENMFVLIHFQVGSIPFFSSLRWDELSWDEMRCIIRVH